MNKERFEERLKKKNLDAPLSLRIYSDQLKWLQTYAKKMNVSVNALVIAILEQFQEEQETKEIKK
jgi:predicted HicB family RNase H-like nuclease